MERFIYALLNLHSDVRWLVLSVALLAILKFGWGWWRGGAFTGFDRALTAAYSGLIDLQALLGIVFFFWSGYAGDGFPRFRFEHGFAMLLALLAAHLPARWRKLEDRARFRRTLFAVLASVALILTGISTLPGGLSR
jgi:hypothetical protein